jgi:hypothetical protein
MHAAIIISRPHRMQIGGMISFQSRPGHSAMQCGLIKTIIYMTVFIVILKIIFASLSLSLSLSLSPSPSL